LSMPSAIEQIVDTYVRLNNRWALEAMLMHRQRLAISIKGKVYDRSPVIEKIDEDIAGLHNRWSVRHGQGNGARKGLAGGRPDSGPANGCCYPDRGVGKPRSASTDGQ